jgi:hypothetical protein
VNFSLDFGTGKIIVRFKGLNCSNIEKYEIYYGLSGTCEADAQDSDTIGGGDGEPASPITISDPDPGEEIEEVVEGLENGETYGVQVVTYDSGSYAISARKCIQVQKVTSLTDLADEDGGYDCFGIAAGREPGWSGVILLVPLLIVGIRRLVRRGNSSNGY